MGKTPYQIRGGGNKDQRRQNENQAPFIPSCPYNFVSLNKTVVPSDLSEGDIKNSQVQLFEKWDPKKNSGYIDVDISLKSDVFIRAQGDQLLKVKHNNIIAGSSIRGVIRNIFETITWSKITFEDKPLYFRKVYANRRVQDKTVRQYLKRFYNYDEVTDPKNKEKVVKRNVKAGFLKKDNEGYYIIEAEYINNDGFSYYWFDSQYFNEFELEEGNFPIRYFDKNSVKIKAPKEGVDLQYKIIGTTSVNESSIYSTKAYLIYSGKINKKHYHPLINSTESIRKYRIDKLVIEAYENDENRDRNYENYKLFDPLERIKTDKSSIAPCFFLTTLDQDGNETVTEFGHTPFFRLKYEKSIRDAINQDFDDDFKPQNGTPLDMTEALFGTRSGNKSGFASRLNFLDATALNISQYSAQKQLPIQGAPKPTAYKHYLNQGVFDNNSKIPRQGTDINSWNDDKISIRGHKFYWDHQEEKYLNPDQIDPKKSKVSPDPIKPIIKGSIFRSRIYFTNITDIELGALLYVLDLPENCTHRIGLGKAFGLGQIRLENKLFLKTITSDKLNMNSLISNNILVNENREYSSKIDYIKKFIAYMKNLGKNFKLWEKNINELYLILKSYEHIEGYDQEKLKFMEHKEHGEKYVLPRLPAHFLPWPQ